MGHSEQVTDKCIKLYNLIAGFVVQFGYGPTYRDMCKLMNSDSTSLMRDYTKVLRQWGWVDMVEGKSRTIHLTRPTENGRSSEDLKQYFQPVDESLRDPQADRHQKLADTLRQSNDEAWKVLRAAAENVRAARRTQIREAIEPYKGGG